MKKIFLFFIILPCVANAANMCVKDDAMVIVLDPQIGGTALSSDASTKTWTAKFPYGVVSGIAGCFDDAGSTLGMVASDQTNINTSSVGAYCYCKMLRPFVSPWIFASCTRKDMCAGGCAGYCLKNLSSAVEFRAGLFNNPVQ